MYLDKSFALRMESCIMQTHIQMAQAFNQGSILELSSGAACFAGEDSFFSQVIAWGFKLKPRHFAAEIKKIENFYANLTNLRVDIELCPYANQELAIYLSHSGYQIVELSQVAYYDLRSYEPKVLDEDIRIINFLEFDHWAKQVAQGFGYYEAEEQFASYIRMPNVITFGAYIQDSLVAGGTLALYEDLCDLAVTSTLPVYRGLGLQKKLLQARLNFAKEQGLDWVMVTTEPGSISDLNVQKLRFSTAYTRIKLQKMQAN